MSSSRYSPMTCLPKMALTPSGLPRLDSADGEVELIGRDGLELRGDADDPIHRPGGDGAGSAAAAAANWIDRDDGLACTLTTHRLVFVPSATAAAASGRASGDGDGVGGRFVHLSMVATATPTGGPKLTSPLSTYKILLSTYSYGDLYVVFRDTQHPSKDRDDVLENLHRALKRRAWEEGARAAERKKNSSAEAIASRKVGVDAIVTRNKLKHREAGRLTDDAFADGDVETLMREAGELVKIINKYVSTLERQDSGGGGGKEDDPDASDAAKLTGMLMDMGMTSALSKSKVAGGEAGYHQTVARQLSDFLRHGNKLKDAGGMMTLTDAYCLFNRARGTNLISPDDLLMALQCMGTLNLGMGKREFPSGVVVIQDDTFDDAVLADKLAKLAEEKKAEGAGDVGGITVLDASKSLRVSAILANEQLLAAERMGRLCRDFTLEGIRFFPNRFVTGEFEGMCR